jgi:hypothetical protein
MPLFFVLKNQAGDFQGDAMFAKVRRIVPPICGLSAKI